MLCPSGGTRIATSDSIEALMEEDFELVINDDVYHVKTPELERPSQVTKAALRRREDWRCQVPFPFQVQVLTESAGHRRSDHIGISTGCWASCGT